LSCFHFTGVL